MGRRGRLPVGRFHVLSPLQLDRYGRELRSESYLLQLNFHVAGQFRSASYVLGDIITDNLAMGGTPTINMALNPTAAYSTLKATLLR